MFRWCWLALVWSPFLGMSPALAQDAGTSATPYAVLHAVLAPAQVIRGHDRLQAVEHVQSKLPGVRAQDIRISIHAKSGVVPVPVGADGSVDFPASEALLAENPPVETNQPKGSLMLSVNVALKPPAGLEVPWSELAAALRQAQELATRMAEQGGKPAQAVKGVEIHFEPGTPASVTVAGRSERLLQADADGDVVLLSDTIAEADKARVVFSRRPLLLTPYAD